MDAIVKELRERLERAMQLSQGDRQPQRFRLSMLHECPRYQFFVVAEQLQEPVGLETSGHFLKGVLFEHWLRQAVFPDALYQYEVELEGIKGHVDFYFPPDVVVEVKATTSNSIPFLPDYSHRWQVQAYLTALKASGVTDDPKGFLLYLIVDNPALSLNHIYHIPLTPQAEWILQQNARLLSECWQRGEPPPIPERFSPHQPPCAGVAYGSYYTCPFLKRCWGETTIPAAAMVGVSSELVASAGQALAAQKEFLARWRDKLTLAERIGERLRQVMRENPDMEELVVEGGGWRVVARRDRQPTEMWQEGAKERMKQDLGEDFLRPYLRYERRIRVYWQQVGEERAP